MLCVNVMFHLRLNIMLADVCYVKVQGLKSYNSIPILFYLSSEPVVKAMDCHTFFKLPYNRTGVCSEPSHARHLLTSDGLSSIQADGLTTC